jgi:recombination protein RecA
VSSSRQKVLDVRKALEKRYAELGDGLFPSLTQARAVDVIPSPSAIINAIVGVGGFPRGRITEIFGPEDTGKTTIAIEAMVSCQEADPDAVILFLDYEHALDHTYAARLGLDVTDPTRFVYCMPDYFEMGSAVLKEFVEQGVVDMVVIDSVAAMIPLSTYEADPDKKQAEGKSGTGQVGLHAALMSQTINWLTKRISRGRVPAVVAINQMRAKVNTRFGTATQGATGGAALKYYSTIRLELGRAVGEGDEKKKDDPIDQIYRQTRVRVTAVKNKVAPPWMRGAIVIKPNQGICNVDSTADLAIMYLGIKSGSWYQYKGPTDELSFSVQGRNSLLSILDADPALLDHLQKQALEKLKLTHDRALKPHVRSGSKVKVKQIAMRKKPDTPPKTAGSGEAAGDLEVT